MHIAVISQVLWAIVAVSFGAWGVASWVLSYHWRSYALADRQITRAKRVYYTVSVVVFVAEVLLLLVVLS